MLRRMYNSLALIALINLFAICGLVSYLFASGRLDEEKIDQIAQVLRGEYAMTQPAATQPVETVVVPQRSRAEIADMQAKKELYWLIGERLQSEIQQRQDLNKSVQLEVVRRLEEIEKKNERFEQEKQEFQKQSQQEGFTEVLEMYSSMEPKLAKELLKNKSDADGVRILMEMDPNRRKKIINACKDQADRDWIRRILDQIQKLDEQ